jgi:hypothetical protein
MTVTRILPALKRAFCHLAESGKRMGLMVKEEQMKYMFLGQTKANLPDQITIKVYTFQRAESFTNHGSVVTANNDTSVEINARLLAANKTYYGIQGHLKSKILSRTAKKTLYIILIRPVLLHALEACTLSKADENRLGAFERRILSKICGSVKDNDTWRARYNRELYELYQKLDVVATVKKTRFQ